MHVELIPSENLYAYQEVDFPEDYKGNDKICSPLVTGRTLSMDYLINDMRESVSPSKRQWHLTTGKKLDLRILQDHEDKSQLVSGHSHGFSVTQMYADNCGDITDIITPRMNNVALQFVAEFHQYSQPLFNHETHDEAINEFVDYSASAVSITNFHLNNGYYFIL